VTSSELTLEQVVKPLVGATAWGCSVGHGSFLMLNFGPRVEEQDERLAPRGLWHLWVYFGEWQIRVGDRTLASHADDRDAMETAVVQLDGRQLRSFNHGQSGATLEFSDGARLTVTYQYEEPDWMLFYPDGNVVQCWGGSLVFSKADV
jgi:hypothetical protein